MSWRNSNAPWLDESTDPQAEGVSTNMKLMLIAAAFLAVTIGLILMQPGSTPQLVAQNEVIDAPTAATVTEPARVIAPEPEQSAAQVTRSSTSLLSVEGGQLEEDVSKMLRRPIRLDGQQNDIRILAKTALAGFGHTAAPGDPLYDLLVQALAERQSNAYIDALLNTAAGRGEIVVPVALRTANGRLDTNALLHGVAGLVRQ